MPSLAVLRHLPKHQGTGRPRSLVEGTVANLEPPEVNGEKYVLIAAAAAADPGPSVPHARRWIDAGASYLCAWGPYAAEVEDTFDHASFLPEVGKPLDWTLMTTAHCDETLEEALWFAFYCAAPPSELKASLERVIIVADSSAIAKQCEQWVQTNTE